MFKKLEQILIRVYQSAISKNYPNKCRLKPTCSNYALIALSRFGFFKGNFLIIKRLFRCSKKNNILIDNVPQNIKGEYKWLL